jgi:hypothetical protein
VNLNAIANEKERRQKNEAVLAKWRALPHTISDGELQFTNVQPVPDCCRLSFARTTWLPPAVKLWTRKRRLKWRRRRAGQVLRRAKRVANVMVQRQTQYRYELVTATLKRLPDWTVPILYKHGESQRKELT